MSVKLHRNVLASDLAAVTALIDRIGAKDPLGRMTLSRRKQVIEAELAEMDQHISTAASVLLSFEGGPVRGSSGIDADFAGRALQDYQRLLATQMASGDGGAMARRGPVPDRQLSRLNITNVVHGSFGFLLEEDGGDEPQLLDSSLRVSVQAVTDLLKSFGGNDVDNFNDALSNVNSRVFLSLKKFIEDLYGADSTLKLYEDDREVIFDTQAILTARERVLATDVQDDEVILEGELLGIVPVQRLFDFQVAGSDEVLTGRVGERFSADYMERIYLDESVLARPVRATFNLRTVRRADGQTSKDYTLNDLESLPQ